MTGFRKRKQERRKKAREDLDIQVKEERKRIKQEVKEGFRDQLKKSYEPIPELEEEPEEFETEEVSVKIVELSTSELAKSNNWIGPNRLKCSDDENEVSDGNRSDDEPEEAVPGMGLVETKEKARKAVGIKKDEAIAPIVNAAAAAKAKEILQSKKIKSKRDLGKVVQKDAMRTLKNSKAFQMKEKLNKLKDRKKARMEREKRIKIQTKEAKKHGGRVNQRKIKKKMKLRQKGKK